MGVGFTGGTPVGNGEWQVFMNSKWTTLPEITTTALNDAQAFQALMKEKERLKRNHDNMIDGVRLAGLTGKAGQECLNGVYLLNEKLVINDHPTFMFQDEAYVVFENLRISFVISFASLEKSSTHTHTHTPTQIRSQGSFHLS